MVGGLCLRMLLMMMMGVPWCWATMRRWLKRRSWGMYWWGRSRAMVLLLLLLMMMMDL
ncbi:hypothetical protein DFP73DRAFT_549940 [Morchella snyderi]|nr:hypothetical protein DFP73DRAFT_549940 [Morchella snyderi]